MNEGNLGCQAYCSQPQAVGNLQNVMNKDVQKQRRQESKEFRREFGMPRYPLISYIFDHTEEKRSAQNARTPFNNEVKVISDVVYKTVNGENLMMDIYLPTTKVDGGFPVVFEIPGGGWMLKNRKRRAGYACMYATMGAVVFVVEHRVSPEVFFPEHLIDVIDAYNFMCSKKDEYNLDLDKITVTGDSAGGHLGACLGVASTDPTYVEKLGLPTPLVRPQRHIFISGTFSFKVMHRVPFSHCVTVRYFCGKPKKKEFKNSELYHYSSPQLCLNEAFPITYNSGGMLDFFCAGEARRMSKALDEIGVRNEFQVGKNLFNSGHCYVKRIPFAPARRDMLKIMTWYKDEMLLLGTDMTEGYARIEKFLTNYHKVLKGKIEC